MDISGTAGAPWQDGLRFTGLLAARLCHEISGPLATVAAAIAVAQADPGATEALPLGREAADVLAARLRLLRAAWAGGAEPEDAAALQGICTALPRIGLRLERLGPRRRFPAGTGRLLLNVALLAADSLPRGGTLELAGLGPQGLRATLHGAGAAWPDGLPDWLADPGAAWQAAGTATPRELQGPLTALLAHAAGARLRLGPVPVPGDGAAPLLLHPA
ncbi:HPTransfase domain-containing protein [Rhodovastum atsumiense]|uniref:histidine phosphotransferase family protein n=1 Tax=Rhodovastum atsumiense TaxID=504468 RepID=UPI00139F2A98|nr:histidine phosphotransferase family protein [Rhodovastum atsumiense]CAH2604015.1 HPTransfase domain-containing protein [Rhodovastum atsumiense]